MANMAAGIKLPGEAADKCCWCVPIKCGIILVGVGIILNTISMIITGLAFFDVELVIWGILFLVTAIPMVGSAFFFIKWFMKMDDPDTKAGLAKGCFLVVVS